MLKNLSKILNIIDINQSAGVDAEAEEKNKNESKSDEPDKQLDEQDNQSNQPQEQESQPEPEPESQPEPEPETKQESEPEQKQKSESKPEQKQEPESEPQPEQQTVQNTTQVTKTEYNNNIELNSNTNSSVTQPNNKFSKLLLEKIDKINKKKLLINQLYTDPKIKVKIEKCNNDKKSYRIKSEQKKRSQMIEIKKCDDQMKFYNIQILKFESENALLITKLDEINKIIIKKSEELSNKKISDTSSTINTDTQKKINSTIDNIINLKKSILKLKFDYDINNFDLDIIISKIHLLVKIKNSYIIKINNLINYIKNLNYIKSIISNNINLENSNYIGKLKTIEKYIKNELLDNETNMNMLKKIKNQTGGENFNCNYFFYNKKKIDDIKILYNSLKTKNVELKNEFLEKKKEIFKLHFNNLNITSDDKNKTNNILLLKLEDKYKMLKINEEKINLNIKNKKNNLSTYNTIYTDINIKYNNLLKINTEFIDATIKILDDSHIQYENFNVINNFIKELHKIENLILNINTFVLLKN